MSASPHKYGTRSTVAYTMFPYGDLTGPREEELKQALVQFFKTKPEIKAAYLADVTDSTRFASIRALLIKSPYGQQAALIDAVHEIFKSRYARDEYLDVIFVGAKEEVHLEGVCQPFYDAQELGSRLVTNGQPGLLSLKARISASCVGGASFLQAVRKKPASADSSGWELYSDSGKLDAAAGAQSWTLQQVVERDPTFLKWLDAPVGTALWRLKSRDAWQRISATPSTNGHGQNGSGHKAQEPAKRFDDFHGLMEPAPEAVDTADGSRHYLDLKFGRNLPVGIHIYYECLSCGGIVSSAASGEKHCRCGNITVQSGVITIKDFAKAQAFRQE